MNNFSRMPNAAITKSMAKALLVATLWGLLFFSCKPKPKNLSEQLKDNFSARLRKADSTLVLDSFIILGIDTVNRRMERIIDDSLYMREFVRVKAQLNNAIQEARRDSIEFYQGEVNYMLTQVDSLTREISKADTTQQLGWLAICKIQLGKINKKQDGMLYIFLDRTMTIRNSEMIDSTISGMKHRLN